MKNHLLFLFIFYFSINIPLKAQDISIITGNRGAPLSKDTVSELKSFSGKYNSGNAYLKWVIAGQHADGLYIIYRSLDGITYEVAGYKKAIGVPISNDIAYYFVDEQSVNEINYYKLVCIQANLSFFVSEQIKIISGNNSVALSAKK